MTIPEKVKKVFEKEKKGNIYKTKEIIDKVISSYPNERISRGSIIPTDYCYNLYNSGQPIEITDQVILFEYVDHATFKYLGPNDQYSGKVYHKPRYQKGYRYIIGHWDNGIRYIEK